MATSTLSTSQTISLSEVSPISKLFSIDNIDFRMSVYPHKSSYIQFNLVLIKLPSNVSSITAYCRLSCKQTHTIFKKTTSFSLSDNNDNDTISWPSNQLKLSEITNIQRLQFRCTVELLHIFDGDENYIDFLSRTPLTTTVYPSHEWIVEPFMIKSFTQSEPGRIYYHHNNINNIWCLGCYPNGINKRSQGQLLLCLELIRLSPEISYIECNFEFLLNHKSIKICWQSHNALFTYNKPTYIWPGDLFSNLSLSTKDTLTFTVNIVITKIGDYFGQKIKKSHWGQFGIMHNNSIKIPSQVLHKPSWSMEAVASRSISSHGGNRPFSPRKSSSRNINVHRLPLIQSKTTDIESMYQPKPQQQQQHQRGPQLKFDDLKLKKPVFESPARSKTFNEENVTSSTPDTPIYKHFHSTPNQQRRASPLRKTKRIKSKPPKSPHKFRADRTITDDDDDDGDNDDDMMLSPTKHNKQFSLISSIAGSASDKIKHPFGFHHDQQPRRYIRKSTVSTTSNEMDKESQDIKNDLDDDDEYDANTLSLGDHDDGMRHLAKSNHINDRKHNKYLLHQHSKHSKQSKQRSPSPGKKGYSPFIMNANDNEDDDGVSTEQQYEILYDKDDSLSTTTNQIYLQQPPRVKLTNDSNSKGSILHSKFVGWLFNVVQLDQYLSLFEKNGKADIRKVRHLTDKILKDMGVEDDADRELILEEAEEYKKLQIEFEKILDKNKILRSLKSKFRANGILTFSDLHEDIQSKQDLQRILSINNNSNTDKLDQIWNIIHPSQSNLQITINKIQKRYNVTINYMDSLLRDLNELKLQMSQTNIFSNTTSIQKQQSKIINDYSTKLRNHISILSKMSQHPHALNTHRSRQTSLATSIGTNSNNHSNHNRNPKMSSLLGSNASNPRVQQLHDTLSKCAKENPTLTSEICNIIVHALKEENTNSTQTALAIDALHRMGTIQTEMTTDTVLEHHKMLTYEWDHLSSRQVVPGLEKNSDEKEKQQQLNKEKLRMSMRRRQIEEEDEEKNDKLESQHFDEDDDDEKVDKVMMLKVNTDRTDRNDDNNDTRNDNDVDVENEDNDQDGNKTKLIKSLITVTPPSVYNPFNTFKLVESPTADTRDTNISNTMSNNTILFNFSPRNAAK